MIRHPLVPQRGAALRHGNSETLWPKRHNRLDEASSPPSNALRFSMYRRYAMAMETDSAAIADSLRRVRDRIAAAALRAGRSPADITLVAVSKTKPAEAVADALAAGQTVFGENRVQEAAAKFPALRAGHPGLRLHIIGGLQTNKARDAVRLADVIESLDRPRLADALANAIAREGRTPDLLVEVNVGNELQKAGILRADADGFIADCKARFGAALRGLMTVPPAGDDPAPHFAWLADRAARHGLPVVSMGMSADFEVAIACGATWVRVGSAIFGSR
jgi:pyridoxal phosphate enzyme (YggS family)